MSSIARNTNTQGHFSNGQERYSMGSVNSPPGLSPKEVKRNAGNISYNQQSTMESSECDPSPRSEYYSTRQSVIARQSVMNSVRKSLAPNSPPVPAGPPPPRGLGRLSPMSRGTGSSYDSKSGWGAEESNSYFEHARTLSLSKENAQRKSMRRRSVSLDEAAMSTALGSVYEDEVTNSSPSTDYSGRDFSAIKEQQALAWAARRRTCAIGEPSSLNKHVVSKHSVHARAFGDRSASFANNSHPFESAEKTPEMPYSRSSYNGSSPLTSSRSPGFSKQGSYSSYNPPSARDAPPGMSPPGGFMTPEQCQFQMEQLQMMMDQMRMMQQQTMAMQQMQQMQASPQRLPSQGSDQRVPSQGSDRMRKPETPKRFSSERFSGDRPKVQKFVCSFVIPEVISETRKFRCTSHIIGKGGAHMKKIAAATETKLRLRGKYSGHKEGPEQMESLDPLQLCISATSEEQLAQAKTMVTDLFNDMFAAFANFEKALGKEVTENLPMRIIDGDVARFGEKLPEP